MWLKISKGEYMEKIAGFSNDGKMIGGEQLLKSAKEVTNGN
ncbi:hypothetical protein [Chitinophaga silvisoli]|nr:hypothetical protein [Chitinophaga silvisoli]